MIAQEFLEGLVQQAVGDPDVRALSSSLLVHSRDTRERMRSFRHSKDYWVTVAASCRWLFSAGTPGSKRSRMTVVIDFQLS